MYCRSCGELTLMPKLYPACPLQRSGWCFSVGFQFIFNETGRWRSHDALRERQRPVSLKMNWKPTSPLRSGHAALGIVFYRKPWFVTDMSNNCIPILKYNISNHFVLNAYRYGKSMWCFYLAHQRGWMISIDYLFNMQDKWQLIILVPSIYANELWDSLWYEQLCHGYINTHDTMDAC